MEVRDRAISTQTAGFAVVTPLVSQEFLEDRRKANDASWANPDNWMLGFYFGPQDTRLWVPRKSLRGQADDERRIINFGHPLGKKAYGVLMTAYFICTTAAIMALAMIFGWRY